LREPCSCSPRHDLAGAQFALAALATLPRDEETARAALTSVVENESPASDERK
jgi:hypothetical protein